MKVSVVVPLYNKADTIMRALHSVLSQTAPPDEIVVIDDGSTDASVDIVRSLRIGNLRLYSQENAGVSAARNAGIRHARNDWIAFLDADDEWKNDYLETIRDLHVHYPDSRVLATSYVYKDGDEEMVPAICFPERVGIMRNYFKVASGGSPPLWTSAVTAHKQALLDVGCFSGEITIGEDLLVWAKLAHKFSIAYHNEPKSIYYFPLNVTVHSRLRHPDNHDLVYRELKKIYMDERRSDYRRYIRRYIGYWCKIRLHLFSFYREKKNALREYLKLFRETPFNIKALALLLLAFSPGFIHEYAFNSLGNRMK